MPSAESPREPTDALWRVEHDVLRRETACTVEYGSTYDEAGVTRTERYRGRVSVATRTFVQRVEATATFTLGWPEATVTSEARLAFTADADAFDVGLRLDCREGDTTTATRHWRRRIPRDLG